MTRGRRAGPGERGSHWFAHSLLCLTHSSDFWSVRQSWVRVQFRLQQTGVLWVLSVHTYIFFLLRGLELLEITARICNAFHNGAYQLISIKNNKSLMIPATGGIQCSHDLKCQLSDSLISWQGPSWPTLSPQPCCHLELCECRQVTKSSAVHFLTF